MSNEAIWRPLREALARCEAEGKSIRLWLRDDDASEPAAALDQLISLTASFAVPVALAAIPQLSGEALVQRLANAHHVTPVIHGWSHQNHAPPTQKKQELGNHRHLDVVLGDLALAINRMTHLFGDRLVPMLVPPWNRISDDILPHLHELGYLALSCFGVARQLASVPVFNTHVDLIDWHTTRGCRNHTLLIDDLVTHVERSEPTGEPIGILTHHLVHDAAAWAFLDQLFTQTSNSSCCRWLSADDLINGGISHR